MKTRELTCIGCPLGCSLSVVITDKEIRVSGNSCKRGEEYAKKEVTSPTRVVTSTIAVSGGTLRRVSVKTERDIPKDKIFDCMTEIHQAKVQAPVSIGDILIRNCAGTGVPVIATKNIGVCDEGD